MRHPFAPLEHAVPVNQRQRLGFEHPAELLRLGAVDQPFGETRQQFSAIAELGEHDLAALDGQRARTIAVIDRLRRSEEHTSEPLSLMRISYAVFCLKKKKHH